MRKRSSFQKELFVLQIASDICKGGLEGLSILDLGCLDATCGIPFAVRGAKVIGIEGRETNIQKARVKTEGVGNITIYKDDVRNLGKYGSFDIILCLGLLYHLDAPDVFSFTETMAKACKQFTIIHTHVSLVGEERREHKGKSYWERTYREHLVGSTEKERLRSTWASLDNVNSFWLTEQSLYNLLIDCGFSSYCKYPTPNSLLDQAYIVAYNGPQKVLEQPRWSRDEVLKPHPSQHRIYGPVWNWLRFMKRRAENLR
jgi:hypothetical protein